MWAWLQRWEGRASGSAPSKERGGEGIPKGSLAGGRGGTVVWSSQLERDSVAPTSQQQGSGLLGGSSSPRPWMGRKVACGRGLFTHTHPAQGRCRDRLSARP